MIAIYKNNMVVLVVEVNSCGGLLHGAFLRDPIPPDQMKHRDWAICHIQLRSQHRVWTIGPLKGHFVLQGCDINIYIHYTHVYMYICMYILCYTSKKNTYIHMCYYIHVYIQNPVHSLR